MKTSNGKRGKAVMSDKRQHDDGRYYVAVTCSNCNHVSQVAFAGWSALVCLSCQQWMNRVPYRKESS